jgi:hypothetical protein
MIPELSDQELEAWPPNIAELLERLGEACEALLPLTTVLGTFGRTLRDSFRNGREFGIDPTGKVVEFGHRVSPVLGRLRATRGRGHRQTNLNQRRQ